MNIRSFLFENNEKFITLKAYIYSFYYRFIVKHTSTKKLQYRMGRRDEESTFDEPDDKIAISKIYAFHVNRITERLPWEQKCFVRALTLRKILMEKKISCTIYMGVQKEDGKMKAHAWLRSGKVYLSGGNGAGFVTVAKFATL